MPLDALGNKLEVGQLVRVKLQEAAAIGYIISTQEPSMSSIVAAGDKPRMVPGLLRVRVAIDLAFIPNRDGSSPAIGDILLLTESEQMKKEKLESATKAAQA